MTDLLSTQKNDEKVVRIQQRSRQPADRGVVACLSGPGGCLLWEVVGSDVGTCLQGRESEGEGRCGKQRVLV